MNIAIAVIVIVGLLALMTFVVSKNPLSKTATMLDSPHDMIGQAINEANGEGFPVQGDFRRPEQREFGNKPRRDERPQQ